ncbi:LysR family transcriptional regulator [Pseudonocardia spinosispora]|uniref:LysR family transcriptional regulator n=1 Tax=Pseudonocardia spinosispora TaxID=103441 RepID=UPI000402955F|nr:LysR family transcriptional regulator [Pseudonocardia spinosispora]
MELRELECFLVLCEELHFGRTARRLLVSQGRVSQLIAALERRIGARLIDRTSRRVALTPLGAEFRAELRPAYEALAAAVQRATTSARDVSGLLRIGFVGTLRGPLQNSVWDFQRRHPACDVKVVELPLADPFGHLYRGEVEVAIVLGPIEEPDLVVGPTFSEAPAALVVSSRHPFARRGSVTAEELADTTLIRIAESAPRYWREQQVPLRTPAGRPIPQGPAVCTVSEGLLLAAVDRGALLLCAPTARYHERDSLRVVEITGLPETELALIWHRDRETATVRAFGDALTRVDWSTE